jgi:hypothetical protein
MKTHTLLTLAWIGILCFAIHQNQSKYLQLSCAFAIGVNFTKALEDLS